MKKNSCKILELGCGSAAENMQRDCDLLSGIEEEERPILHLYDWEGDCATYGYFINPDEHLDGPKVLHHQLQIARRPTGGGVVFHHCDFAFSFLLPASHPNFSLNTLENYAFVNQIVVEVIRNFRTDIGLPVLLQEEAPCETACTHFCMAKPTIYDVIVEGRKIGGAAQRRTKGGYLHQGTVALTLPPEGYLMDILKGRESIVRAMYLNSYPLLGIGEVTKGSYEAARQKLRQLFIAAVDKRF